MNLKGIVFITAVVVSTASARADTVFWSITNNSPWQVQVEFENEKGTLQWPGGDKAYTLFDGTEHTYNLSCHTGDRIKYGAWTVADNHETGLHFWVPDETWTRPVPTASPSVVGAIRHRSLWMLQLKRS